MQVQVKGFAKTLAQSEILKDAIEVSKPVVEKAVEASKAVADAAVVTYATASAVCFVTNRTVKRISADPATQRRVRVLKCVTRDLVEIAVLIIIALIATLDNWIASHEQEPASLQSVELAPATTVEVNHDDDDVQDAFTVATASHNDCDPTVVIGEDSVKVAATPTAKKPVKRTTAKNKSKAVARV